VARPEEISAAVELLCDFDLRAMTGQIVQVNGGSTRTRA
jgi:NAD(P)-dependent dehydrogenase (short-subunit alcohol dehydrogenase family)